MCVSQAAESLFFGHLDISWCSWSILAGERNSICDFSDAICHSTDSFFLCLSLVGFPHMAQPSQQLPVPLSLTLSLCEDGDMLGGSPAVWQKNVLALVWRLLAFWHVIFAVECGHSAAGFPCKVGPAWHPTEAVFSRATYPAACIHVLSASSGFHSAKVTVSITRKCCMVNPPLDYGQRLLWVLKSMAEGFAAKPCLQMMDWKRTSKTHTHNLPIMKT